MSAAAAPVRTSSLARLPPPSRVSTGAKDDSELVIKSPIKAAPAPSSLVPTAGSGGSSTVLSDALLTQISSLIDQKLKAARAISSLPTPTTGGSSRARNKALVGGGALHQLRANAGLDEEEKGSDDPVDDEEVDENDGDVDESNQFAPLATPASSKSMSALDGRIAAELWKDIKPYGTAVSFVKMYQWNNARNSHEAESIAWALDAFMKEKVGFNSLGFEIMIRRLFGVRLADEGKNWDLAKSIAWKNDTLLSRGLLRSVLKDAKTLGELSKSAASTTTPKKTFAAAAKGKTKGQNFAKFAAKGKGSQPSPAPATASK